MTLTISSDLIAGVLKAGSPGKISAATKLLADGDATNFGDALLAAKSATPARSGDLILDTLAAADPAKKQSAELRLAGKTHVGNLAAFQKFEAALISNAFEDVLPGRESGAFGEGFAGGVWRSMAAEQFASLYTARGGVGIAEMLERRVSGGDIPQANPSAGQWPYFQIADVKAFQT